MEVWIVMIATPYNTLSDINECFLGTYTCGAHEHCNNTIGNYTCDCDAGFDGSPCIGNITFTVIIFV